ncbi:MAG TPA: ATP-binding protein [Candidatus Acidoferrales bacterium]|nr:ATP-binding protein [Candidatus Acidoferrales bacterium]
MTKFRNSLSKKLTAMNMLVSAGALLLASVAFFGYDLVTFRTNLVTNASIQAQIIGSNAVSPLLFNDSKSAETTLSGLRASQHITYAGIYSAHGDFLAGYWRDQPSQPPALPSVDPVTRETVNFADKEFILARSIPFQGKEVGYVFIRSDLGAINDRLRSYAVILFTILTASLVAALTLSRISQRSIARPILALADTAKVVSEHKDYSVRMPVPRDRDEVSVLVDEFNQMLTEIQNRDSALQQSEEQFRTLANSIAQMAWMGDSEGNLTWYNQRWYEYTGTTLEQMAGWGWQQVHDPQKLPEVLPKWRAALVKGEVFEMIIPLRGADGNFRQFLTRAVPIRDAQGKVARWFGTNTDITEQLRAEENLRQTEKLAATGRLAASIAHEINNPLEAVTNLIYLARRQPANAEKYLRLADEELDRIAQITKNTLGFYRDSASPTKMNLSEALQEVLALYSRKMEFKRIVLICDPGDDIEITGYPGEVRQVFANLIANAIDALPREGTLRVRASRGCCRDGVTERGVRITFLDNGSGISSADLKKIFAPFYTTKKNTGTGLGLWLVKGLVEKHRGTLHLRSSTEQGRSWTAFSVFLPEHALRN